MGAVLAAGSEWATDTLILAIQGWKVPGCWAERHWPKVGKRPDILDHIVVLGPPPPPQIPFPVPCSTVTKTGWVILREAECWGVGVHQGEGGGSLCKAGEASHAREEMPSLSVLAAAGQVSSGAGPGPVSSLFPSTLPSPLSHVLHRPTLAPSAPRGERVENRPDRLESSWELERILIHRRAWAAKKILLKAFFSSAAASQG